MDIKLTLHSLFQNRNEMTQSFKCEKLEYTVLEENMNKYFSHFGEENVFLIIQQNQEAIITNINNVIT